MGFKPDGIKDILSLTPVQEGILFHYLKDPESNHYFEQLSLQISGTIKLHYFEEAWNKVIEANEMLRTVFRWEKLTKPSQLILKEHKCRLIFYDLSDKDSGQKKKVLEEIKDSDRRENFDLHQVPFRIILCKLNEIQYEMIISSHHILYDGWSNGIILKEFFSVYHALSIGKQTLPLPAKSSFKKFIKWLQNQDKNKQERFWNDYLAEFETPTDLPIKKRKTGMTGSGYYSLVLEGKIRNQLDMFVKSYRETASSVFYTAWGILLQKYCDNKDVIFGTTISGRSANVNGIEDIVGLFINTIPLRVQFLTGLKIIDIVTYVENSLQAREEFQYTSLADIINYACCPGNPRRPLFDTIVVIENYPLDDRLTPSKSLLKIDSYSMSETTHYDLSISIELFNEIKINFNYKQACFDQETIANLAGHFKRILLNIIVNPQAPFSQLEILSQEEKNQVLYEFNNTAVEYPVHKSIHRLIEEQVERTPDRIALIGSSVETLRTASLQQQITHRQLNEQSNRLAALLIGKGVLPDHIIGLMIDRSLEMIIGLLGILKSGGAYLPIDPGYPRDRIDYMLKDSGAAILLADERKMNCQLTIVNTQLSMNAPRASLHYSSFINHHSNLAYVIYTSGSTGKPKGAMVQMEGFFNLLCWYAREFKIKETDNILLIAPISFDLAQKNLFSPFIVGGCLTLACPGIPDYHVLTEIIQEKQVTLINCAPSMFYPLLELNYDNGFLKLKSLRKIILGGESIQLDKLLPWVNSGNYQCEIVNTYGPTECTDIASCYWISNDGIRDRTVIPIGKPIANVKIFILDKYLNILPVMVSGEVCIGGIGVSRGYCNNPTLSQEKFIEMLHQPGKILYRSGDIGRWLLDGNIEFLGRIDHQVKVRGLRIELEEIERQLLKNKNIKDAVVVIYEKEKGHNYLCAYVIVHNDLEEAKIREYLAQHLPGYMIPTNFVKLDRMPLTPSGKVDRKSLPAPVIEDVNSYVAPRNEIESKLTEIWSEVLGKDISANRVGIDNDFFQLGGHSLKVTSLTARIYKEFNVKIPLMEIFKRPTIRELFHFINTAVGEKYTSLEPVEKKEYYILSSAQKRLYFLHQMDEAMTVYNISAAWIIEGNIDKQKLEQSFVKLIARHESLRTSFVIIGDEPVQRVQGVTGFEIEYKDAAAGDEDTEDALSFVFHHFIRAFDLSQAPLLRVGLIKIEKDRHIFLVDMHHIISDGISSQILVEEISAFYAGNELPGINIQYKDYAEWQKSENSSKKLIEQGKYWKKEYEGDIPVLELPTDYIRPVLQEFAGNSLNFELKDKTSATLKTLALEKGSTLYIVLLALYNIFLSRLSNKEDIIIGSPVAGRRHVDLEKIIGMFVNTLPLRNYPSGEKIFVDFLHEVKVSTLKSFENQEYLYEDMVDQLSLSRDTGRNPLFDTMFVLQNTGSQKIALPGLKLIPYEYESKTAKFDLTLIVVEEEKLHFTFEYNIKLFKEATIRKFITYLINIIEAVVENCRKKISDFGIISEEEKSQILFDFNNTKSEYPADKTIHYLFAEQAAQTPDHIAVFSHGRARTGTDKHVHITYFQLNKQSDRLAGLLMEKGILAGDIVAIMLDRFIELITGIMGILKAGSIYMPIDPEYPQERIDYMLKDSNAKLTINYEFLKKAPQTPLPHSAFSILHSNHLAYIIYTSGSTGKPKGVIVSHRNVVRLVKNTNFVPLKRETRILQTGAPVFDATTFEIWGSLLNGGQLVLTDKETIIDAYRLAEALIKNRINTLWLSAPLFNQLSEENLELFSPLKYLLVGGDVLSPNHINRVKQRFPGLSIINGYGPTENTTFSTTYLIEKEFEHNIPIGRPIANSTAYIYDKNNHLTPIGIAGELFVGGDGLALGYLNNPELTTDKFEKNRFYRANRTNIFYKTGDLAKWLSDGNIEFLGRSDQQVKIRGFRVELEEIENYLLKFGKIKETVVIPVEDESKDKTLAAYIVWDKNISSTLNELKEYLQAVLPGYMIPAYIVELEKLPLTQNGKIDRKLLPAPERKLGKRYLAPRNETENKLVEICSEILRVKKEIISVGDNFFELGGHSLKAMLMVSRIQKEFNVKLPLAEIFKRSTIKGIAEFIKRSRPVITIPIAAVGHRDYYTLSAAQRRMYLLYRLEQTGTVYNMPSVLLLAGKLEVSRFEAVIRKLIQRHESFRTSFELLNEEAVQRIHDEVEFKIEYKDLATDEHGQTRTLAEVLEKLRDRQKNSFIRPFDLSCAPLLRVGLLTQEEHKHLLIVDMPHIISDGMSMGILVREFMAFYAGGELPSLEFQYKDYAEWQQGAEVKEALKSQEKYWLEQFENEVPVLNLPTDFIRPKLQNFEGRSIGFEIGLIETNQLKQLALEQNTTLYMVLLAAFNILLSKLSGQEDIVIGTPTAGRRLVELEFIIGMFVNTLALRHYSQGEKSFVEFLGDVTGRTLAAFENQDYPFEELVEKVVQNRDMSRNPLFDVMFALQNMDISEIAIPGLKLSPYTYESNTAKFDITLSGVESDNGLHFNFEYSSKLFEETTIRRFIGFFKKILTLVPVNPTVKLAALEIISEEERKQILVDFNNTDRTYPAYKDISQLIAEQVEKTPDRISIIDSLQQQITYRQLNEQSSCLAALLIEKGVLPDNIVGLMVDRSIEMMVGLLGILKSGGAYLPIDPKYPQERIDYMVQDSNAKILLIGNEKEKTDNCQLSIVNAQLSMSMSISESKIFPGDPGQMVYLIYTSGSTGQPKGVMVQKKGFLNLLRWYIEELNITDADNHLLIAPISFDLAQKNLFSPFLVGGCLTLAPAGVPDYRELTGIIVKKHITMINCAPSVFYPLIEINHDDDFRQLRSLRAVVLGGEPIRSDRLLPWVKTDSFHCEIFNTYGPTECTDIATCFRIPIKSIIQQEIIPIGRPIANVKVYVLDKYFRVLPVKIPGELCIGGIGVSQGYYQNKQLTEEKFIIVSHLPGEQMKVYRTGDLVCLLVDGNIEFLGRIDHQVKIRGFRIELGEIENELLKHKEIKEAVAITRQSKSGENYLCAYLVPRADEKLSSSALREYLGHRLPDYMVPAYFIYLEAMPLTPSGKINRRGLPEPEPGMEQNYIAPRDHIEEELVKIWQEVFDKNSSLLIGIDDNFFQLGGHSLKAAIMTAKVHKALHVEIPLSRVFETPTIRALSTYIKETREKKYDPVEILPEGEYYELSSAQKRLYILQQMDLESTGYNMPIAMRLLGELDAGKLEKIFKELINRHESLRTSFKTVGDRPMQKIHAEIDFKIEHYKADTSGRFDISHFVRVFDLSCAPLVRVGLVKIDPNEHIAMIDMHHIIADGTSLAIFYKEMMALYQGNILPSLKITYKDYAALQNNQKNKEILDRQGKFWLEQFAEDIPVLNLPIDYSRPVMQSFEGNRVDFELSREETELLKGVAQSQGATLYMAILAACNTWLSKISGEEDIVIGSPVAGRNREEFQEIIGMFVNTLPLRNYPAPEKTFAGFLKEIKERTLAALENQDYPFEDLVEKIVSNRDTSRNPIFDVMFVFQNMDVPNIDIPGLMLRPYDYEIKTSKFDLNLAGMEIEDRISFSLEYSTKLFKEETIRRFAGYFKNIIHSISENPGIKLTEIEIIDKEEKKRILEISNGVTGAIDFNETIHGWFEKIVPGNEHKTALVFKNGRITYGELNRRANRLAFLLQSIDVGPGKVVGLMVERSFEMIIGMLAIMKAGGAYLPIDPKLPGPRKQFMIENANISALLTNFDLEKNIDYLPGNIKPYDLRNAYFYQGTGQNPPLVNKGPDPVYVLFTSGSTGRPKGVMLQHTNLVNLIKFQHKYTNIDCSKVLQFTTISFDVSFQEIFTALTGVGELYLITQETREHISQLFNFINKNKIKTLFFPMSFIKLIFSQDDYLEMFPGSVIHIVTAGEQVIVSDKFRNYLKQHQIYFHNHYGPSETHVVTTLTMNPNEDIPEFPSIGKPIMNTCIYILDKGHHLQPVGIAGELVAGGLQVGRGYLNNPEITADKFKKNRSYRSNRTNRTNRTNIFYKTGDLAKWLADGNIEFLGRVDHQVKIRGIRVEPGEIENRLKKIPFIKDAVVVVSRQEAGDKYLCAYLVLDKMDNERELDISQLRDILSVDLPDYMIPASFIPVDKIPLTPSGKVDRKSLPEPGPKESKNYMAPRDEIEKKLVDIWSEILGMTKESIGIGDNFFHLGGHSLKATLMVSRIQRQFKVKLTLAEIFKRPTISALANYIRNNAAGIYIPLAAAPHRDYYDLSAAQRRMYLLYEMDKTGIAYNMPLILTLEGNLDISRFETVLKELIQRHESFRTSFEIINGTPFQRIHDEVIFKIEYKDLGADTLLQHGQSRTLTGVFGPTFFQKGGPPEAIIKSFIQPFDLAKAPLLRVVLLKKSEDRYLLVLDMHHIITDGISFGIFVREFMMLYAGKELPLLKLHYRDYSEWLNGDIQREVVQNQKNYWLKQFEGDIPVLDLPTDFVRPMTQSFEGKIIYFKIAPVETAQLKKYTQEKNTTLYVMLLSVFGILISKLSRQEDIIIGTPTAGRRHADLESIIGMFVNTLALRNFPVGALSFDQYLQNVTRSTLDAFENQDYPFEDLVEKVVQNRAPGRNPLFDVLFVLQNMDISEISIPGLKLSSYPYEGSTAKFDIILSAVEEGDYLNFGCEYCSNLFKENTILRFFDFFKKITSLVLENPGIRLSDIEIISEEEKKQILVDFNNTAADYPMAKTIHELFIEQAEQTPDHIAVFSHGLTKGEEKKKRREEEKNCGVETLRATSLQYQYQITYHELHNQSGHLAGLLTDMGVHGDSIVAIMIDRCLEMIVGIMGILKSGAAYLPIDPGFPQERIDYMLKDSGAAILLTDESKINCQLSIVNIQLLMSVPRASLHHSSFTTHHSNLAYIIYTSGSTGKPKGVLTSHSNVTRVVLNTNYLCIKKKDRILQLSNYAFDGSVFDIYGALLNGAVLVMVRRETLLEVDRLADLITREAVTVFFVTTALFNTLVETRLDSLAHTRKVLFGGERVSVEHSRKALARLGKGRLIHVYGPTETTVYASYYFIDHIAEGAATIPIGAPLANTTIYIFDKYLKVAPLGISGEVYIGGRGTARGYLNNPELTADKFRPLIPLMTQMSLMKNKSSAFRARFHHSLFSIQHSNLYRTGDLARWLPGGNIEFLGRIDYQVKIRGFRVELGEIESYILKFANIKEVLVISLDGKSGDKTLAAYIVSQAQIPISVIELREYLQQILPGYMVPTYFMILDKMPLTAVGKIDRKLLPVPGQETGADYAAPRDEVEKKLVDIWSEILGIRREAIGIEDNFFHLGGHSLKATLMASRIQKEFKVKLPLAEIFKQPTVKGLAEFIKKTKTGIFIPIKKALHRDYYDLSAAQRRMYLLYRMDKACIAYNIPLILSLAGALEVSLFEAVITKLIQRHESFRTSFELLNETPVQRIHDEVEFKIEYKDLATDEHGQTRTLAEVFGPTFFQKGGPPEAIIKSFIRPFDLSRAPLLRVELFKQEQDRHLLIMDMHHIISDGMSMGIFVKEFMALYAGQELPALAFQYKDYALWQQDVEVREALGRQEKYWLEQFENEIPVLNLPTDYVRPKVQGFEGQSIQFEIGPSETIQLKQLALEQNTTLYMILLAAFGILLAKTGGQEDIVIGTPTAGRRHVELESIIGMFVNTLALRHFPHGEKSFDQLLEDVTGRTLKAFENQDYPFEDLVEKVVQERDMSRNPLFDVMFVLQNMEIPEIVIPGLKLSAYPFENNTAKFDITLSGVENDNGLHFNFQYCIKLFEETTIRRFIGFFKKIITIVLENPAVKLSTIEIIPEEEKKQILENFNNTDRMYPAFKNISQLFDEQVEKTPDRIAVIGSSVETLGATSLQIQISYHNLNDQSNHLAGLLIEKGVLPDNIVGIMLKRSIDMIIGIFGILKSGGAYLPIDLSYPEERINYMLKDSGAKILITNNEKKMDNCQWSMLNCQLSTGKSRASLYHASFINHPSNLAYIIYTSGSTGRPKGVMVEQGNLVNLVEGLNRDIYSRYDQTLNICLIAPFIFDASIKQIFAALLLGHKLSIVPEKVRLDGMLLLKYLIKYNIDISDGTPSYLRLLTESITKDLLPFDVKYFIIGGEALTREITEGFFAKFSGKTPRIINIYGPTECTVDTTFFEISPANIHLFKLNIPIGKLLSNCRVYIINKYQQLQPIGIPGELLVSGNGVGRGYLSNPEMTCEKFVFDPFVKGNRMNHSRMYRTGDLARWLPNGNIEFLGRIDFQVKIRGFRIELGEIENYLLKFGKIKEALVIPVEDEPGEKNLAAYIVWDKEISFTINDLREYLQTVLPGYMIPGYFIELEKLPLSINGKIDRKLLPAPTKKSENRHTAPRDEIDKKLTDIWSEILSTKGEIIGIDDNFFQLGGHSLKAAIMTAKVHKALHVEIPLSRVFETPTIRALSTYINETREKKYDPVEILPEGEYYELSSAQKRLYILQQMGLGSTGYNMPIAMRLLGELDAGKLEKIFKELINRHESLRTSFKTVGDRPMQKINAEIDFKIGHYRADTSGCFDISHFVRVFDLSCAPLVRVGLVKISPNEHIVMIDMHHIIADGTSLAIFYKEMMALYQGNILPSLKITYKDYAAWQNNQKNKEILDRQGKFWLEQFAEDIPVLNLPIDYSRPVMQSFEGNRVDFELSREETELLKRVAQSQGATLYMAILAACNTWLSKLSGEEDIVIGTPVAGRNREEFQEIIGMFVNTLPLRNYPAFEKTFAGFLKEIKERTLTALENQDYPFEDLVEKIVGTRDTSRNPIFDVMFVFQNMDVPNIDIPGLMLRPYDYEIKTSKFDLNLAGMEIEDRISFSLEYSTKLFKEETIRRFAGYFKNIIHSINLNPVIKLTEIEIIDPEEKKRILEISNGVTGAIDLNETIHGWFEKIVPGNEHKTALVFKNGRTTYGELNRRANRLAFLLQNMEVGPGKVVGLMVERSFEMIIGMLAVMKAGGAYLPIDPKLPGPRKQFMIENANISALLTNFDLEKNIDYLPGDIKPYDLRNANFYQGTGQNPPLVNKGSDPVYVLFTSGSTGKPKGVMLKHTNLVNLIKFQYKYTDIDCSKVLQFTTISFDVSFQEIFTALTGVGELYLITQETREHISHLFNFINKNKIKTLFFPMSFIKLIFSQDDYLEMFPGSITHIVTAGEQVIVNDKFRNYLKQHQIYFHNHYGPSETHVVTTLTMNPNEDIPEFPSIGKPIMNTWIYILDKGEHIQPVGIAGELVAGGLQVGSGYLNNPEITADKFRPLIKNKSFSGGAGGRFYKKAPLAYKTGDLARWLPDGKIEFLGRIDHQVKIRGIRVEPGEIENRLKKIPSIKDAVVIVSQQTAGDKYLCAYLVLDKMDNERELDISQLRDILSVDLPDYMIPASFIPVDKIPLTPSGKVDRKSLPEPGPKESKNYMAPRDEIEKKLVDIWSEILGMTKESIGIGDNFFHLGGHSLKAINMINKIHKHFGVMVALQDVFRNPDIASLSKIITNSKIKIFKNIEKQEKKEYYELSYAQKRLWFIGKTDPGSLLFNMPGKITLYEAFDEKAIRKVLEQLTARHESLRTAFKEINKEPVQIIEPVGQVKINFQVIDISEITGPEQEKQRKELFAVESRYIFNLSQPPLLRIMTITCGAAEYDVVFNMHHIISDGWSLEILKQEFQEIYDAYKNGRTPSIESKELQYTDYAAWQNRLLADEEQMGKAQEFWREQLSRNLPVLNLPYDFSCLSPNSLNSPHSNSKESAGYHWVIPGELANRLRSMAEERQASLFMILLAGFNLLLAKISCQEDIIIAIPAAARQHEDLRNIIGLFVNTLILCNHVATNEPFPVFFECLQENTFHVLEYQDIPLESICGQLKIKYPEVSMFFNMVNTGTTQQQNLENLAAYHLETVQDAKFEIVCYLTEYRNGIDINCHYYKNRFKPLTIEKIMEEYQEILINMAGNSAGKISEYFTGGKKRKLKRGGNIK